MAISTYFGSLASSCEGAAKLVVAKSGLAGLILYALSGFFWTAEALTETPPEGRGYFENIKDKLKLRFSAVEESTPKMKWAVAAGVFSMISAALGLTVFLAAIGPSTWMLPTFAALAIGTGISWYKASNWNTTSGALNKLASGSLMASVIIGVAAAFAPPLAILGTLATIASYISTTSWFLSYPAQSLVGRADQWQPVPQTEQQKEEEQPNHTTSPWINSPHAYLPNGRLRQTFKPEHCVPTSERNSLDRPF